MDAEIPKIFQRLYTYIGRNLASAYDKSEKFFVARLSLPSL